MGDGGDDRGDATPTSEGEGDHNHVPGDQVMHPGGAVSLSAAIPRITSQPQVRLLVDITYHIITITPEKNAWTHRPLCLLVYHSGFL